MAPSELCQLLDRPTLAQASREMLCSSCQSCRKRREFAGRIGALCVGDSSLANILLSRDTQGLPLGGLLCVSECRFGDVVDRSIWLSKQVCQTLIGSFCCYLCMWREKVVRLGGMEKALLEDCVGWAIPSQPERGMLNSESSYFLVQVTRLPSLLQELVDVSLLVISWYVTVLCQVCFVDYVLGVSACLHDWSFSCASIFLTSDVILHIRLQP